MFRFIDDLISLNDDGEFSKSYREIYPEEMELQKENAGDQSAPYLDMGFSISASIMTSILYDKRNAFKFSVVRLPYKCSNIPSKMFYATIGAEVLRIAKATSTYNFFIKSVHGLLLRMKRQGADLFGLKKVLRKMLGRHFENFQKFNKSIDDIILECCT